MILTKMQNLDDLHIFTEEPYITGVINKKTLGQLLDSPLVLKVTVVFNAPAQTLSELKLKVRKNTLFP